MLRDQVVAEHHDELFAGHFSVKMYTPYKACYSTIAHAFIRKESKPSTIPLLWSNSTIEASAFIWSM